MIRRTENWPLAGNGARHVPGWDDGPQPTPPDWRLVVAILVGIAVHFAITFLMARVFL